MPRCTKISSTMKLRWMSFILLYKLNLMKDELIFVFRKFQHTQTHIYTHLSKVRVPEPWQCIRLTCTTVYNQIKASRDSTWMSAIYQVSASDFTQPIWEPLSYVVNSVPELKQKSMNRSRTRYILFLSKEHLWKKISKLKIYFKNIFDTDIKVTGTWV